MKIKIFGIKIVISFWFAAIVAVMLFCDRSGLIVPTLCLALLHELAHLIVMRCFRCAPEKITLKPGRIEIHNQNFISITNEIIILLSGPLLNLFLAGIFYFIFQLYNNMIFILWCAVSFLLGVYNLLPIRGLDGGSVLYDVICRKYGPVAAHKTLSFSSFIFAVLLIISGALTLIAGEDNVSILIFGCYLVILYAVKR